MKKETTKEKIKLIIFDIDNTLIYGEKAERFYAMYKRKLEQTLANCLKCSHENACAIANYFRRTYDGQGEKAFEELGIGIEKWYEEICDIDPAAFLEPLPQVARVLQTLAPYAVLGAITDGPITQAERILKTVGIPRDIFRFCIGWEKGCPIPKGGRPNIFQRVCKEQSVAPRKTLVVGDSLRTDIEPAQKIGCKTFHIKNGRTIEMIPKYIKNII